MKALVSILVSGTVSGSLYAIMTVGLTLVYGVIRLFNFGHGLIAILGGYLTWFFLTQAGLPMPLSVLISCAVMYVFGLLLFNTALKKLMENPKWDTACIFFLIGVGMVLENGILQVFGPRIVPGPDTAPTHTQDRAQHRGIRPQRKQPRASNRPDHDDIAYALPAQFPHRLAAGAQANP